MNDAVSHFNSITNNCKKMDRVGYTYGLGFDWDSDGNMIYKHDGSCAWNYTFDTLNRLTAVQKDGSLSALYTYDADGRRVRSWDTVDGTTD